MKLKKRYFILPMATLSLLSGVWMIEHSHHNHFAGRSIASEDKVENKEVKKEEDKKENPADKIKSLEDLVACQKKVISDLKDDMAKKIDDLKKIVADYDSKQDKKKDKKDSDSDIKVADNKPDDQQTLAVLMYLTSMMQNKQFQSQYPSMSMSYTPVYDQMMPQHAFYRNFYENTMFYDQIGLGNNYLHSSYPRMGYGNGGFNNYQNPYQFQQTSPILSQIPSSLQRMPMLGDEFNFTPGQGLVRQPSSGGFNF